MRPIITRISHLIHGVVAREMQDDGHTVGVSVAEESERITQTAWDPSHVS